MMRAFPVFGHFTKAACARALGVSRARVTQLCHEGKLALIWLDGRAYVSGFSLRALILERDQKVKLGKESDRLGRSKVVRR